MNPIGPLEADRPSRAFAAMRPVGGAMDRNLSILITDSSRVARRVISRALASELLAEAVEITAVGSGQEALHALAARQFDLVTCSLLLPDMYGLDLCRALRSSTTHRFTPFLLVTAEPFERVMRAGYGAGVTDYFDKNQGFDSFIRFIRAFAQQHAGLAGKLLYVEDNEVEAKRTAAMMRRRGLEVVRTHTAEDGLALLDESFSLVVVDFYLKGDMSGGDFLHSIRCGARRSREELPVLIVTSSHNPNIEAEIFHAGANDFVVKPVGEEVLISRIRSLLLITRQFSQLSTQREQLRELATTDGLTGVFNKRHLLERVDLLAGRMDSYPVWVALVDLDRFKAINDCYGHMIGDQVLKAVGALLAGEFRREDLVARFGGEEFIVVMPRCTRSECRRRMEGLRHKIENLRPAGFAISASIGVAGNEHDAKMAFNDLVLEADMAMYRAKDSGRNRVVFAADP
jgi:two-component system cell cycle response regulator